MTHARRILVTGRVQGVGYRDWTVRTATGLGLAGWVRNRMDGSVEIVADGDEAAVATLTELCHEGPSAARVTAVHVEAVHDPVGHQTVGPGFEFRPTV